MKKELSTKHYLLVHMPYVVLHVLLKHNVLSAWYNNSDSSRPLFWYRIDLVDMRQHPEKWIDYAFLWSDTPEGDQFWCDIYKEIIDKSRR